MTLHEERFQAAEILFRPHLADKECLGVAETVFEGIMAADLDLRAPLLKHIVLSGGTTTIPGFKERLESELKAVYRKRTEGNAKIKVYDPENRKHAVFTGGAVLAELMSTSEAFWVGQEEWREMGAKCLSKWRQ